MGTPGQTSPLPVDFKTHLRAKDIMSQQETSVETKTRIILDEANLTFAEISVRKDKAGERTVDGSVWDDGKMDGEFDDEDFQKILDLQLEAARICDAHPELEEKTDKLFQSVTPENADDIFKQVMENEGIKNLARISVIIFMFRFPTVQSFVNKGHPLVLATDEYMLENSTAQNWHDYNHISQEMDWTV